MLISKALEISGWDSFWDSNNKCWTSKDKDRELQFALIFGDPRGDCYLLEFADENELIVEIERHMRGNNGCDFPTEIYLIVCNGIQSVAKIRLESI